MKFLILLGALLTTSIISQAQTNDWSIVAELKEPSGRQFGESAAISRDGKTILVAAATETCSAGLRCGAAYVYTRDGSGWHRQAKLSASDAITDLRFGGDDYDDNTIALSGDGNTAFVGTDPDPYVTGPGTGAVYIFVRDGEKWSEQQKLTVSGSIGFGRSVAISNDGKTAVVGDTLSYFLFGPARAAYIFEKKGNQWEQTAQLTGSRIGSDGNRVSPFGRAVAISGDGRTVLIGSPGSPTDLQEAYVFKKTKSGWLEQAILSPADKKTFSYFGSSVALSSSGDTAVVGSVQSGVAYVFRTDGKNGDWQQEAKLGANITDRIRIGFSVDIDDSGDNVVAGDYSAGTSFLFHRLGNHDVAHGKSKWVPELLISKDNGLGSSVAISGDAATVLSSWGFDPACILEDGSTGTCPIVYVLNRH